MIHKSIIGPYLRRVRLALEPPPTQEQVAEAAGVSRSQYNRWEAGRSGMEADKAAVLAPVLKVPEAEIRALADEAGVVAELALRLAELENRVEGLEDDPHDPPAGRARS